MKIGIIGGTGPEGQGLGFRWALAGHEVIIGSRREERGRATAEALREGRPDLPITGGDNLSAIAAADVAVLAVPYEGQMATLDELGDALSGKLLITVVAPTGDKKTRVRRLESGLSAAEEAQAQLGEGVRVVAAFQNIGAHLLLDPEYKMDCDVLICGQKGDDKEMAARLAADAGLRGVNAGSLQNASVVEGLTSVLIFINFNQKVKDAGIFITGLN